MSKPSSGQDSVKYLALGDSYTIGEQVAEEASWPMLLASFLRSKSLAVEKPEVIAVTGWRTDELMDSIAVQNYQPDSFDLVSLLIGVNNQYQGKPIEQFETEFEALLKTAISLSANDEKGVFVVGIPDYSESEYAKTEQLKNVSQQLKKFNRSIKKIAKKYEVAFYPLQTLTKPLHRDKTMLAEDLLHPSELQYRIWVDSFKDRVADQLKTR